MKYSLLTLALFLVSCSSPVQNIGIVDEGKVFRDFTMTKEANKRIESVKMRWVKRLDSLELIATVAEKVAPEKRREIEAQLIQTQTEFQAEMEAISTREFTMVWNRINLLAGEFANENGYTVLMGKREEGIWYNQNNANITDDFIKYLNSNYTGQ